MPVNRKHEPAAWQRAPQGRRCVPNPARPCRGFRRGANRLKGGLHRSRGSRPRGVGARMVQRPARARPVPDTTQAATALWPALSGRGDWGAWSVGDAHDYDGAGRWPVCGRGPTRLGFSGRARCFALSRVPWVAAWSRCVLCVRFVLSPRKEADPLERRHQTVWLRLDDLGDVLGVNQHPPPGVVEVEELPATPGRAKIPRLLEVVLLAVAQAHRKGAEGLPLDEFPDRCRFHASHRSPVQVGPQRQVQVKRVRTRNVGDASGVTRQPTARSVWSASGLPAPFVPVTREESGAEAPQSKCAAGRRCKKRLFVGRRTSTVRSKPAPGILSEAGGP